MVIVIIYLEGMYKKIKLCTSSLIHSRAMDNSTTSGSIGELKEASNLIIYIIGLILLIIWKVTVMPSASTFETQTIGGVGSAAVAINRIHILSSRILQVTAEQYG